MITEKLTLQEKIDIRKIELEMYRDVENLVKTSTKLYKRSKRDIHMRCFLRRLLKKSKWNIVRFIIGAPINNLIYMRRDDKFMIKSYWMAKRNLKMAAELHKSLENPSF